MPIHDWGQLDAGHFHNFHLLWIGRIEAVLNEELLPDPFSAVAENVLGDAVPDVLTLEAHLTPSKSDLASSPLVRDDSSDSPVALAPSTVLVQELTLPDQYAMLARRVVIRDRLRGDGFVALIEIVSRANRDAEVRRDQFVNKSVETLRQGIHLLVVDLQPPSRLVPRGFHDEISRVMGNPVPDLPPDRPLQAVSYQVLEGSIVRAHVVPLMVGDTLPEMPIFLLAHSFVRLPLERSYREAFRSLPRHVQKTLTLEGGLPASDAGG